VGKTALAREAAAEFPSVYHRVPPLPEQLQRRALAGTLRLATASWGTPPLDLSQEPSWDELFTSLLTIRVAARPHVLVLDDAHRFVQSRTRILPAFQRSLARARADGRPLHIVTVSPESIGSPDGLEGAAVALRPLSFRAARPFLPGPTARDQLRSYAAFGGFPAHLIRLEPSVSLATNLRKVVLEPGAVLADAGLVLLERSVQTPSRYVAALSVLARGQGRWGRVHDGIPDLTSSGQAAPYLKRLVDMGLVETRRSLDAGPSTRSRRYRITDPFIAFWYRFVLPGREEITAGGGAAFWAERVRPALERHLDTVFDEICRQYMRQDAMEVLGVQARECGSLWGPGYDIPVSGTLSSGAMFYGRPVMDPGGRAFFDQLDREVRETRYGFGREVRLRIAYSPGTFAPALRSEAARRRDAVLVDARTIAGEH
jgi:hypothetical protein